MGQQLVAALIGLVVGGALAWLKAVFAIREKVNEELRSRRVEAYPPVYRLTAALSLWPSAEMTYDDLADLNLAFREWYFTVGGLYLSANSRDRYGEMKQLISAYLDERAEDDRAATVLPDVYEDLTQTTRAFRDALTEDLETRRQRSLFWVVNSWRVHRKQHERWRRRIDKVGGPDRQVRPHPLREMPLPPLAPAASEPADVAATHAASGSGMSAPACVGELGDAGGTGSPRP